MIKVLETIRLIGKCLMNKDELRRFEEEMGA